MTRISGLQNMQNMRAAAEAALERAPGLAKPTLKRYTWSRLHSRPARRLPLVAGRKARQRAAAAGRGRADPAREPRQPLAAARLRRRLQRRGMAARWNVDADTIGRIYAELERSDIGWIDQDQIVTFWDRNPDIVDDTAAERQQRVRDRKKGMKQLAALARQGFITEQQRRERELALKDSREPKSLMAAWANLSTDASRRDSVTVTTRSDQIINQDLSGKEERGLPRAALGAGFFPGNGVDIVDFGQAQLWLETEGKALVTARMAIARPRAGS
jgi:hypothetical protein